MKILHEWHFHNRVCRVVESDPGIVHFEEATRTTGDPSIMLFSHTPTPMGAANEIIQLSMALAEANVINRDLSAAIQRWQEDRTARDQEIERLRARVVEVTAQRDAFMDSREEVVALRASLVQQAHDYRAQVVFWGDNADQRTAEVASLRARVEELKGMVPRWVPVAQKIALDIQGWLPLDDQKCGDDERLWLMVPPIPLPETKA
jgi:hypothetical protein